ncbi:MAG TPA: DUF4922 domain-containing protein [Blastocatellia bacterium]|nr:DUF4922 domain-containing protein [Blastocatellia bacterium]
MTWESRLITDDALAAYAPQPITDFPSRVAALIQQQLATWPLLRSATAALDQVQYKELDVNGSRVLAQFNPARIVSTAAKVDTASIQARPCFLCAENLPAEEKGVPFGEDYVVLCNPFPVLKDHLVISERRHTPQAIAPRFADLLDLTKALGSNFFTLYNGPQCGASAPDHHHFQACSRVQVPLFDEIENWPAAVSVCHEVQESCPENYRLNLMIAQGGSREYLVEWFTKVYDDLVTVTKATVEPMMNLVATFDVHQWTVYVFPRAKHRPTCYFAERERQLTISPAGIDLAGVLVVPNPAHFDRLTAQDVAQIYTEITLPH